MSLNVLPRLQLVQSSVLWLMLTAISIHLIWYHGSKPLMDLAGILALITIFVNFKASFRDMKSYQWGWCAVVCLLPVSYAFSYVLHDSVLDKKLLEESTRIVLVVCSVLLICRFKSGEVDRHLLNAVVACTFLGGGLGFIDWASKGFEGRTSAGAEIINLYSAVLAATTSIVFLNLFRLKTKFAIWLYCSAIVFGALGVVASGSRAGLLALLFMVVLIGFIKAQGQLKKYIVVFLVLGITTVFSLDSVQGRITKAYTEVVDYFQPDVTEAAQSTSVGLRLEMWYLSGLYILDKPLTGYGNKPLSEIFSEQIIDESSPRYLNQFHHVHSDILQSFLSRGIFGVLVYLLLIFYPIWIAYRNDLANKETIAVFSTAFFLTGLSDVVLIKAVSQVFYLAVVTLMLIPGSKQEQSG